MTDETMKEAARRLYEALLTARDYVHDAAEGRTMSAREVYMILDGSEIDRSMERADLERLNAALSAYKSAGAGQILNEPNP